MWNKWKNHFSEMKGDVGMPLHEKEGEQEDDYIDQDRKSLITLSLHLCFSIVYTFTSVLKLYPQYPQTTEQLHST